MAWVRNVTRGCLLAERAEVATSFVSRLRGLLGRRGWTTSDGLWIAPCSGVHTLGMRFPIDVILLDDASVTLWAGTLRPWRLGRVDLGAVAAVELPVGRVEDTGTKRGDAVTLEEEK